MGLIRSERNKREGWITSASFKMEKRLLTWGVGGRNGVISAIWCRKGADLGKDLKCSRTRSDLVLNRKGGSLFETGTSVRRMGLQRRHCVTLFLIKVTWLEIGRKRFSLINTLYVRSFVEYLRGYIWFFESFPFLFVLVSFLDDNSDLRNMQKLPINT